MRYLFLVTALWHTAAAYYFLLRPGQVLRSLTNEAPVSPIATDVVRFLGGLNLGYAVVAGAGACHATPAAGASLVLALANGSQLALDLYAHRTGRWTRRLVSITLLDGIFTLAYGVCLAFGIR